MKTNCIFIFLISFSTHLFFASERIDLATIFSVTSFGNKALIPSSGDASKTSCTSSETRRSEDLRAFTTNPTIRHMLNDTWFSKSAPTRTTLPTNFASPRQFISSQTLTKPSDKYPLLFEIEP